MATGTGTSSTSTKSIYNSNSDNFYKITSTMTIGTEASRTSRASSTGTSTTLAYIFYWQHEKVQWQLL